MNTLYEQKSKSSHPQTGLVLVMNYSTTEPSLRQASTGSTSDRRAKVPALVPVWFRSRTARQQNYLHNASPSAPQAARDQKFPVSFRLCSGDNGILPVTNFYRLYRRREGKSSLFRSGLVPPHFATLVLVGKKGQSGKCRNIPVNTGPRKQIKPLILIFTAYTLNLKRTVPVNPGIVRNIPVNAGLTRKEVR